VGETLVMQAPPNDLVSVFSDVEDFPEYRSRKESIIYWYLNWLRLTPKPSVDVQSQGITELKRPVRWLTSALADVARIADLPHNWDGYGSAPLGVKEREHVTKLLSSIDNADLPAPNIVPVSGGGIQLEWQYHGRELELEIVVGSEDLIFLKVYPDGMMEENSYPIFDLDKTKELLNWLLTG
jgi:hypothetical protein